MRMRIDKHNIMRGTVREVNKYTFAQYIAMLKEKSRLHWAQVAEYYAQEANE